MEDISGFICTKKRSVEHNTGIFTLLFFKVKPHLKIRFIALQPRIFPISNFKESSAYAAEKSFRITCSILSMTLLLHRSALKSFSCVTLFINLEIIIATLNKQEK